MKPKPRASIFKLNVNRIDENSDVNPKSDNSTQFPYSNNLKVGDHSDELFYKKIRGLKGLNGHLGMIESHLSQKG